MPDGGCQVLDGPVLLCEIEAIPAGSALGSNHVISGNIADSLAFQAGSGVPGLCAGPLQINLHIGIYHSGSHGKGIDIGSRVSIYEIINDLTKQGIGILMLTSDMVELIGLSDRTLVFYEGKIMQELSRSEITEEKVMKAAIGISEEDRK